jgi:CRISPR/Cas system-associated exonuclease Cas4 (RecB family)
MMISRSDERTTADLLLEWDRSRPRSRQRELGWSELGGCRRRAGYRLAGVEPTNPGGSLQAVMGTAIHDAVQQRLNEIAAAEDLVEYEVVFAGIKGHLDRYEAATATLVDVKTTSSRWLEHIKLHGPDRSHLFQLGGYGAALIAKGYKVKRVVIDYLARDTGELYRWSEKFDPKWTREALAWLDAVRGVEPEMLNRDYAPDSAFCQHCPFRAACWDGAVPNRDERSVLLVEDGDALKWAHQLQQAREQIAVLKELEEEAKGALDAIRPNDSGRSDPVDVGLDDRCLQWTVTESERLNTTLVKAEYKKANAKPPTTTTRSVRLSFVPRPEAAG